MEQESINWIQRMFTGGVLGGILPGMVLGYANLSLLKWTLVNRTQSKNGRQIAVGLFLVRLILLAIVLYIAYLLLSLKFVLGLAIGMLVHKLFFVASNLSVILFKRNP